MWLYLSNTNVICNVRTVTEIYRWLDVHCYYYKGEKKKNRRWEKNHGVHYLHSITIHSLKQSI